MTKEFERINSMSRKKSMGVQFAKIEHYENWLELAKEVEPLFGPMAEEKSFQTALRDLIEQKQAFCIKENAEFCGAIAISKTDNEILWLAVSQKYKGKGYGRLLLEFAMNELDDSKEITVQTFAKGIEVGEQARKLYQSLGFVDLKQSEKNPAGYPTVIMVKK